MSILTRVLLVLIGLRLLLPPGICVCKISSPAVRLLARVTGGDAPTPTPESDDHHPGCPASMLSLGLGVKPASPTLDDCTSLPTPVLHTEPARPADPTEAPSISSDFWNAPPLYVSHCTLRC